MESYVTFNRPFRHSRCEALGSSKEVRACHTGSKENFHENLRCDRLQPPWLLLLIKGGRAIPASVKGVATTGKSLPVHSQRLRKIP